MFHEGFTVQHRMLGRVTSWAVFCLVLMYIPTTVLGFLSLKSPQDPIGDPYFSMMELLILLIAPLMVVSVSAVHAFAPPDARAYSLASLIFMVLAAGITCCVHFVILTVSRQLESAGFVWTSLLLSFKWPSVAYTLDILAWDGFFAIAILFSAFAFRTGRLERAIRGVMIASGVLSLVGLAGVPLAMMNVGYWLLVRNIGIIGYALVAAVAFLLLGILFGRPGTRPQAQGGRPGVS